MKRTTKAVAWLWMFGGIMTAFWFIYGGIVHKVLFAPFISAVFVLAATLIPAISLLKGGKDGWWAMLIISSYNILNTLVIAVSMSSVLRQDPSRFITPAISLICLIGLLADQPKKWRGSEPATPTTYDKASIAITAIAVILIAASLLPLLYLGYDYLTSAAGSRMSIK